MSVKGHARHSWPLSSWNYKNLEKFTMHSTQIILMFVTVNVSWEFSQISCLICTFKIIKKNHLNVSYGLREQHWNGPQVLSRVDHFIWMLLPFYCFSCILSLNICLARTLYLHFCQLNLYFSCLVSIQILVLFCWCCTFSWVYCYNL